MRYGRRLGLVGAAGLMGLLAVAPPARAVEYRLHRLQCEHHDAG